LDLFTFFIFRPFVFRSYRCCRRHLPRCHAAPSLIENAAAILAHELDPKPVLVDENDGHLVKYTDDINFSSAAPTELSPGRHCINWDIIRSELKETAKSQRRVHVAKS